ncbi:MAG: hypothetical protein ACK5CW_09335 [Verrucomicrobiota bacterium]
MAPESQGPRIVYCRCAYAQVVPQEVKDGVLAQLAASGQPFTAVADLCEMAARRDPLLRDRAGGGPLKIAACHRRAVLWLFHSADAPLDPVQTEIVNMRRLDSTGAASRLAIREIDPSAD